MRWPDERYVKVYTRDTPDWLALGWEARALFWELLRKADRAGLLEVGKSGNRGIAALTGIPVDVVERTLPALLEDGCVEQRGPQLLIRNYIEAQNANQSDKARQQKAREAARDKAMREESPLSQNVTATVDDVTKCDTKADFVTGTEKPVTPIPSDPIPDNPISALSCACARSNEDAKTAHDWLTYFNARFFASKGRQRGCSSDAKATANLADLLAALPDTERAEDWEARERIVDEFLARTDQRTVEAGWKFAFFVASFDGLRLPPDKRPTVRAGPGKAGTGGKPYYDPNWRQKANAG